MGMSFVVSLFAWGNAIYTFALATTIGFALLQVSGVLGWLAGAEGDDGDSDHGVDADADHDVDADHDADVDGDHDADSDADHDGDDADEDDGGSARGILATMGGGRVPFSMIWQTFGATFGLSGLALNTIVLAYFGSVPTWSLLWTLPIALIAAFFVTRFVGGGLARVLAHDATQASSRRDLVGRPAVVISSQLSTQFGEVRIKDKASHVRVVCKLMNGPPVSEGTEVVIVDCKKGQLFAAPFDTVPHP
jgi:membrane protein implicated in regulation of membrane protease activity